MAEADNQPAGARVKTRSRSALADISNTVFGTLTSLTKGRNGNNTRKRKLSNEGEEGDLNETKVKEAKLEVVVEDLKENQDNLNSEIEIIISDQTPVHSSSNATLDKVDKTVEEIEFERYGFFQPPKIERRLPLQTKGADPKYCFDILDDIYAFYFDVESIFMPKPYFDRQTEVTPRMRTILVDWIVEVHYKYHLAPQTLWLTINILDRYLEKTDIPRNKLQLVGITSLFLACKFEEIHSPQVNDCVYLTDNAYTKAEILGMESSIVDSLDYQLMVPTAYNFLIRYLARIKATERVRLITFFAAERNLQEVEVLVYSPKVYAAAAVYIGLYTVNIDYYPTLTLWTRDLEEESGLEEADVVPCAKLLMSHLKEVPQASSKRRLDAARKKYSTQQTQFIGEMIFPNL